MNNGSITLYNPSFLGNKGSLSMIKAPFTSETPIEKYYLLISLSGSFTEKLLMIERANALGKSFYIGLGNNPLTSCVQISNCEIDNRCELALYVAQRALPQDKVLSLRYYNQGQNNCYPVISTITKVK